ncbi:hypothetical protein C1645_826213 [Glomus cerebriforme]|uniref:Uncharacterized protein n=1 Tax=Glomus cerebriforme TaxID=658196 RepID=A0A397SUD5_9GLOM|nr:hypothetical protein C1645_826213 [Glomus cerebriforme]
MEMTEIWDFGFQQRLEFRQQFGIPASVWDFGNDLGFQHQFGISASSISVLAHENDNDIEMEAYKGDYGNDIEVELEQDNIKQNFDNE